MVKIIEAYEARDGSIHSSKTAAAEHEARLELSTMGFRHDTIDHILKLRGEVATVLDSILPQAVAAEPAERYHTIVNEPQSETISHLNEGMN